LVFVLDGLFYPIRTFRLPIKVNPIIHFNRQALFSHILRLIPLFSGFMIKGRLKTWYPQFLDSLFEFQPITLLPLKKLSCIF